MHAYMELLVGINELCFGDGIMPLTTEICKGRVWVYGVVMISVELMVPWTWTWKMARRRRRETRT